jgi:hypothetical protein
MRIDQLRRPGPGISAIKSAVPVVKCGGQGDNQRLDVGGDGGNACAGLVASRMRQVWTDISTVALADDSRPAARHACVACARALGAAGTGLSVRSSSGQLEPVFATDFRSEQLEEMQLTLGQGPLLDSLAANRPVLVSDLSDLGSVNRWPMFAPEATGRGIGAVFAFPVTAGAARLGVLNVYRQPAGSLPAERVADALAYADALLVLLLDGRADTTRNRDQPHEAGLLERRADVHQAAGMVSVQSGIDVADALVRLRAYAFVHDRSLADVAADVVARRLRFARNQDSQEDNIPGGDGSEGEVGENGR